MAKYCDCSDEINRAVSKSKEESRQRRKANEEIGNFTFNRYFPSVPVSDISRILERYGFDSEPLEGIYTGRQGKSHDKVGEYTYFTMFWYKMESGKYEITAYLS